MMPEVGEVRRGYEIGYNNNREYMWHPCSVCGDLRWALLCKGIPRWVHCRKCAYKDPIRRAKVSTTQRRQNGLPEPTKREIGEPLQAGDIVRGGAIGRSDSELFIYHACVDCGKLRYQHYNRNTPEHVEHLRCHACAWEFSRKRTWKGGRCVDKRGYVSIKLSPDDPFYPMCDKRGYVYEHRLAMARQLGRCLLPHEQAHHKGVSKSDNRPEKLELRYRYHGPGHTEFTPDEVLEAENVALETETAHLKERLAEAQKQLAQLQVVSAQLDKS